MIEPKRGLFARSLAGHDKGSLYVILEVRTDAVLLADGKQRSASRPKKKNRRHIQIIGRNSGIEQLTDSLSVAELDATIRKAIHSEEENACQKQM